MLRMHAGLFLLIFGVTSCLVTDEIEFEDKINMPPVLKSVTPLNDIVNVATDGDTKPFTVTVWDPDDGDGLEYEGLISVIGQTNSTQSNPIGTLCEKVSYNDADPSEYDGGVEVVLYCRATFLFDVQEQTSIIVVIDVSDRGFLGAKGEVPEDARQLRVQWTWELNPEGAK